MKKRILLIDGNSFCYRAFYAIKNLSSSKGQPTNAIYGFVTMLNKLKSEYQPQYLGVAFDLKGPTFRHKRFSDYKIKRKPMPDDLSAQLPLIKEILGAYRIAIFEKQGFEADDIIATLAKKLSGFNSGLEVLIVTGDKDILQILDDNIKIINPHKDNLILNQAWVRERYGVSPGQIIEIMALAGDKSDNIPGVPGIGEATAIELIKDFGGLDQVLANTEKIANKGRAQRIKEFAEQARISRELVSLDLKVPEFSQISPADLLKQLEMVEADKKRLFEIFKELEFHSLVSNLLPEKKEKINYQIISNADQAEVIFKQASLRKKMVVYLWGTSPEPMRAKALGLALSLEEGKSFFISAEQIPLAKIKPILEDENIKKTGHDLKYAKVILSNCGINLAGIDFDTMLAAYLLNPSRSRQRLSDLAPEYLNLNLEPLPKSDRYPLPIKEGIEVCCRNLDAVFRLRTIFEKQLKGKDLLGLFKNIEMPLIEVLADMEREGVALEKESLLQLSSEFENKLKSLTKEIYQAAGCDFNINSPQQLSAVLFERLKLPRIKRTKTGSSTDTEVLQKLIPAHPIAHALLEFREISKLKSTYLEAMAKLIHPQTGRIHASFNQTGTATGRFSSSRPNLQNIPIKTRLGKKIRQIFIPAEKDNLLLSADYSQIELRILAHLSQDKNLISAFKKDLDIHDFTASLIFGVSEDKVTAAMRDAAKVVNFGITYGMSAYGLCRDLGIAQDRAQKFIDAYFQRYPGVKGYIASQIKKAKKDGYVTTLMKRRRYIPEIKSENENAIRFAQRVAINAPVQGSAADLIKAAMIQIHRGLKAEGFSSKMIIQVHDELVFSVPQQEAASVRKLIQDKMENVIKLKVPLKVSIKAGKNWLEMN